MKRQYDWQYVKNYCDSTSLESRNNFRDDVYITVIGHLNYIDNLIYFYKGIKNVLFVVDSTSNTEHINRLQDIGDVLVVQQNNSGFGNINYQCVSSAAAAEYLSKKNVPCMIRMRSDQLILQLEKFINKHKFDRLSFLAYINQNSPHYTSGFDQLNKMFMEMGNYETHNLNYNYVMDYCISGPTEDMNKMFTYREKSNFVAPAEHKLLLSYLLNSNLPLDNSFEFLSTQFYFMLKTLTNEQIDFIFFKQNYNNWSVCLKQDSPDLYVY